MMRNLEERFLRPAATRIQENNMTQQHPLSRTELLVGGDALKTLRTKTIAVLGIGGVGGYAVEALARCGVGGLLLADDDTVCLTNINRQLHAMPDTVGRRKVDVMAARVHAIDPAITIDTRHVCVTPENIPELLGAGIDYVIDALDTVSAKIAIAVYC
ncbi:MAG TPA: hypothetical protein ENN29_09825, partial [Candidatus Hydrogenedentes bacterium]|nr:hypothetical protein [Candidatus Hydrogenedentota bacterium]